MGPGFLERMVDRKGEEFIAREYAESDRAALAQMYDAFEPKRAAQGLPPVGPPRINLWLERVLKRGRHIVVEVNGKVCGHVMLIPLEDESKVELANFLHQSIRGRGIGTAMNQLAVRLAKEAGIARVWLSVEPSNRAAVRSYEKAGFKRLPGSMWSPEMEMAVDLV